jgi:hypothetical protein
LHQEGEKIRIYKRKETGENILIGSINNRCEDSRSPVSASCVTVPKPDSSCSIETGINPGIRS